MARLMSKAMEKIGKNTMEEEAMFAETLLNGMEKSKSMKRKGEDTDLEPQGKILIEEDFHMEDDGHKVVDWTLRNLLRPINGDPNN